MSYLIIGVHGLSKKPQPKILADGWRDAICEGIQHQRKVKSGSIKLKFKMVDWIDLYYPKTERDNSGRYKKAKRGSIKKYDDGWFDSARGAVGDFVDTPLEWFKRRGLITDTADAVLDNYVKDLGRYYENKTLRNKTRRLVMDAIKQNASPNQRIMLIGHSMGSIITYDALRLLEKDQSIHIDHYITIGSPLGLPHVQTKLWEEFGAVRAPENVSKWSNFADKRDPVALDSHLRRDFKPNSKGVRPQDDLILNDWGSINHKSYGYLRCPEVSEQIASFV